MLEHEMFIMEIRLYEAFENVEKTFFQLLNITVLS